MANEGFTGPFGVAIERSLLRQLDGLSNERHCSRSELLRDLARAAVARAQGVEARRWDRLADAGRRQRVRDLSDHLVQLQHELGDHVRASLHVHLTRDLCLEVIVMRGRSDVLQAVAHRILAMRGVKHGGIEIITNVPSDHHQDPSHAQSRPDRHIARWPRQRS